MRLRRRPPGHGRKSEPSGWDSATALSAPSVLDTADVQDGLLAAGGVLKASGFVTSFQAPFRVPNNLLLTLMKGDEVVEARE